LPAALRLNVPSTLELVLCDDEADADRAGREALFVHDAAGYLDARRAIYDHLTGDPLDDDAPPSEAAPSTSAPDEVALRVYVLDKRYWQWLADLRRLREVDTRKESARRRVEKRWNAALPASLESGEVRALALSDLPSPPHGRSVDAHVTHHRLGEAWTARTPSPAHAARLLAETESASSAPDAGEENDDARALETATPWLDRVRRERLQAWADDAPPSVRPFYRSLRATPEATRALSCAAFFLLQLRERARREDRADYAGNLLQEVRYERLSGDPSVEQPADVQALFERARTLRAHADGETAEHIRANGHAIASGALFRHWRSRLRELSVASGDAFAEAALAALPGHTAEEVHALRRAFREEHADAPLPAAAFDTLRERHATHPAAREALDALRRRVMPPVPAEPEAAWQKAQHLTGEWTTWLTEAYFPYLRALMRQPERARPDEAQRTLEKRADAFSDWFVEQYPQLLQDGRDLVTDVGRTVAERLDADERVVWLVWDNLPAHHEARVVEAMQAHGFERAAPTAWKLALLPSVTETSFPASLSGLRPDEAQASTSAGYVDLVQKRFSENYEIRFENSLRNLEDVLRGSQDLSVFHYRAYDSLLHRAEAQLDDRRENKLDHYADRVFERLAEAFDDMPSDRPISLVISSDHGSTNLPPSAPQIDPPPGTAPVEEHSSRAIRVAEDFDPSAPQAYSADVCTPLDPDDFGLSDAFLIARGFRAWKTTRAGSGYVHGGALPEEVLVPLIQATRAPVPFTPLRLHHLGGTLRRGEVKTLRLRIENRSDHPVSPVRLRFMLNRRRLPDAPTVEHLPAQGRAEVDVPVRIEPSDPIEDEHVSLRVALAARFLGRNEHQEERLHVPARERAVRSQTGENLDDFFD
jgi:hypothetical protein